MSVAELRDPREPYQHPDAIIRLDVRRAPGRPRQTEDPGAMAPAEGPITYQPSVKNIKTILQWDPRLAGRYWRNDFTGCSMVTGRDGVREWGESDIWDLWDFMIHNYGLDLKSKSSIRDAVEIVTSREGVARHPLREYLDDCRGQWDHKSRLNTWLVDLLGARVEFDGCDYSDLIAEVGRRWMIAAVARAFKPGSKQDCVLILKGGQGTFKSTALRCLGGRHGEFFSDSGIDLKSKDAYQQIRGVWIYEFAELDSMDRSTQNGVKRFLSSDTDRYRPTYGATVVSVKRSTVFCGTTNEDEFLKDLTGNRRYWIVETGRIDLEALEKAVPHLWGEAYEAWRQGERWHLSQAMEDRFETLRGGYVESHPWEDKILHYITHHHSVTASEVLEKAIQKLPGQWTRTDQKIVCGILRGLGMSPVRHGGHRTWRR